MVEREDYAENINDERVRRVDGSFDFAEVDAQIFVDDEINPELDVEQIRGYIW